MKNAIATASFLLATCTLGWSFGSGVMEPVCAGLLILSWIGISWSCMQD
jgi:hypothetical protein